MHTFGNWYSADTWIGRFLGTGWFWVNLFFVLSGFVLMLSFAKNVVINDYKLTEIHQLMNHSKISSFYFTRFKRLYTLFLISGFIGVVFYSGSNPIDHKFWMKLIQVHTTAFYMVDSMGAVGNGPFWSLAVEIYLSLLLPALLFVFRRYGYLQTALFLCVASALFRSTVSPTSHVMPAQIMPFLQALSEFSLGMAVGIEWKRDRLPSLIRYPRFTFLTVAIILLGLILYLGAIRNGVIPGWRSFLWILNDCGLAILLASALLLTKGWLRSILTNGLLQLIGMMCFSIYIWHMPLLGHLGQVVLDTPWKQVQFVFASFFAIMLFSMLSYRFIEFPNKSWKDLFVPPGKSINMSSLKRLWRYARFGINATQS